MVIKKSKKMYRNDPWWNSWYYCDLFKKNAYGGWFKFELFHPVRTLKSIRYVI